MCGIYVKVADLSQDALIGQAERAMAILAHRGPDGQGIQSGEGWVFGHRRLAVFDVSERGAQPMSGWGHTIVFNGAIYNFRELRKELAAVGYSFSSQSDTEVILAAFVHWGTECFRRFNGMWALAIINHAAQELTVSRDRYGIKPLYYSQLGGVTFASEPRAIVQTLAQAANIDRRVAEEFLLMGWQDHREETLYRGVLQFPAAHYATLSLSHPQTISPVPYYSLEEAVRNTVVPRDERAITEHLRELLVDSVRLRSRSDVGRCITLSGGIDSSSVAGLVAANGGSELDTYSALFPGTEVDESPFVEAVNERSGLRGHAYYPGYEDFLRMYPSCQHIQGQPLASMAVAIHYGLMERIRTGGEKVLLNGQGADEIGAGYDKFYLPLLREQLRQNPLTALSTVYHYTRQHRVNLHKLSGYLSGRLGVSGRKEQTLTGPYFMDHATQPFQRSQDSGLRETSANLLREVGLPALLRHEDRNTMAFGLESRVPFLDHRVVNFMLALPSRFKIRGGVRKYAIRQACREVLPDEVYRRYDKLGFATPAHQWMAADAQRYIEAVEQGVKEGYLAQAALGLCQRALNKSKISDYNFVFRCWAWMQFVGQAS